MPNRTMVKLIHADGFFPPGDAEKYALATGALRYTWKPYGHEIENFNMIFKDSEQVLSKVLGEKVIVHPTRSGVFRRPSQFVHFENFESLDEWCFVVALEKTTFNTYHHLKSGLGESGVIDAKTALEGHQFNYRNLLEWNVENNVVLEPNQGVFFRPWVFHSLSEGKLVQYYRLITDRSIRVLVMGLPGSGKTELAKRLHEALPNSAYLNSMEIRKQEKDIDFKLDGIERHAYRMVEYAREHREEYVILDMVCPKPHHREIINSDFVIYVATKDKSDIEAANEIFEPPRFYDIKVRKIDDETISDILEKLQAKRL